MRHASDKFAYAHERRRASRHRCDLALLSYLVPSPPLTYLLLTLSAASLFFFLGTSFPPPVPPRPVSAGSCEDDCDAAYRRVNDDLDLSEKNMAAAVLFALAVSKSSVKDLVRSCTKLWRRRPDRERERGGEAMAMGLLLRRARTGLYRGSYNTGTLKTFEKEVSTQLALNTALSSEIGSLKASLSALPLDSAARQSREKIILAVSSSAAATRLVSTESSLSAGARLISHTATLSSGGLSPRGTRRSRPCRRPRPRGGTREGRA